MKSDLIKTLNAIEHPILELESHGGSILVLPDSGRVLGLFDRNNENFYWVNPDLTDNTKLTGETEKDTSPIYMWVNYKESDLKDRYNYEIKVTNIF